MPSKPSLGGPRANGLHRQHSKTLSWPPRLRPSLYSLVLALSLCFAVRFAALLVRSPRVDPGPADADAGADEFPSVHHRRPLGFFQTDDSGEVDTPWRAAYNLSPNVSVRIDCKTPDVMALAWGSLAERMQTMCLAQATAAYLGARLCVLWLDSDGHGHVRPSELFRSGAEFVRDPRDFPAAPPPPVADTVKRLLNQPSEGPSEGSKDDARRLMARRANLGRCPGVQDGSHDSLTADLFFAPDFAELAPQLAKGSCILHEEMEQCMQRLEPTPAVNAIVHSPKNDLDRIRRSTAVFIEDIDLNTCAGCSKDEEHEMSAKQCAMRHIAMAYLRNTSQDFAVASRADPSAAQWVADVFDPRRAPLVPHSAKILAAKCPLHPHVHPEDTAEVQTTRWKLCAQHELALLHLLGRARGGLVHLRRSAESQVISALQRKGAGGGEGGPSAAVGTIAPTSTANMESAAPRTQFSICLAPKLIPLTRHRFAKFFVVEEKLNLAYCAMPKVACTSWKMWFRAMLGLPEPMNIYLAHSYEKSGLGDLSKSFSEEEAVRLMTKPGMYKFVFVRNPFVRISSTYLNKLVFTDAPDRTEGWGTRPFWNQEFFRDVWPLFQLTRDPQTWLVSFNNFLCLIREMKRRRIELERHIADQIEICGLDTIKYDFVGRFETLGDDVKHVLSRFDNQNISIFKIKIHPTNSDAKLLRLYTPDAFKQVQEIYGSDLHVPLNNIHYEPPPVLARKFGSVNVSDSPLQSIDGSPMCKWNGNQVVL